MRKIYLHKRFDSFKSFPEIEQLGQKVVDDFVKKETNFNSWEEMQQRAVSEYMTSLF